MRQLLPLSTARADNFVGGVSMGGFGAFKLAFSHPDWFSAVMAMSPVVDLTSLPQVMPDYQEIFSGPLPNQYLEKLAQEAPPAALKSLRTFYCIGDQDILKPQNARFVRRLQDQGTLTLDSRPVRGITIGFIGRKCFPKCCAGF